ncbi:MAG: ATP-binding protein [Myxococcota bacterium]
MADPFSIPDNSVTSAARIPVHAWPWLGGVVGLMVAGLDIAANHYLRLSVDYENNALLVWMLASLFFGLLGYMGGRLAQARRRAAHDAATIHQQFRELEATRAQVVEHEKLASIGRMAAGVAHEVRNPLAVIGSATSLLAEGLPADDAEGHKAASFVREEIARLDGFIGALLDFVRPVALERRQGPVRPSLEHAVTLAGSVMPSQADVRVDVPEAATRWSFDADLLAQLVSALVINAAEAVADDGRIRITAAVDGATLVIEVVDDGPGIDPEVVERLFEPFVTTRARGTGLGLPMAQRIARAHGGWIESVPGVGLGPAGRGACIRVFVPASEAS